jgi:hypothetical protein
VKKRAGRWATKWAKITAYTLTAVTVVRVVLFVARLGGAIGTIEAVAQVLGYGQAISDFEDMVDMALHAVIALLVSPS